MTNTRVGRTARACRIRCARIPQWRPGRAAKSPRSCSQRYSNANDVCSRRRAVDKVRLSLDFVYRLHTEISIDRTCEEGTCRDPLEPLIVAIPWKGEGDSCGSAFI